MSQAASLRSILYIEGDHYVRTTAKLVLEVIGKFEVHACGSVEEALHAPSEFKPDLILLEVNEPGLDGIATLKQLRLHAQFQHTPMLFVSNQISSSELACYREVGVIGVIPKPLVPLRLTEQINSLWERHSLA